MVLTKTSGQPATLCSWYTQVTDAVRSILNETPGGAIVIHVDDIPDLIRDEDNSITDLTKSRLRGLGLALRRRQNLRQALYRIDCLGVMVIYDPERITLERAREIEPNPGYAQAVLSALSG